MEALWIPFVLDQHALVIRESSGIDPFVLTNCGIYTKFIK
jgi:hypothetical protein